MGQPSGSAGPPTLALLVGAALLTLGSGCLQPAFASRARHHVASQASFTNVSSGARLVSLQGRSRRYAVHVARARYARGGVRLQCVSFARAASGIELKGNAANWWDAAAGIYERGQQPEAGSVLNFRSTGHMRLGHVAVVTAVVNSREIEIEHANWAGPGANRGGVARNISVVDVSASNDWSSVRVGLGRAGDYGSVYPTYGFIYDRADRGVMTASSGLAGLSPTVLSVDELDPSPRRQSGRLEPVILGDGPSRGLR